MRLHPLSLDLRTLLAVVMLLACSQEEGSYSAYRFADQQRLSPTPIEYIQGTVLSVLDPAKAEQTFTVMMPRRPVLTFAIGLSAADPATTVRFEISTRDHDEGWVTIFKKELSSQGWSHERIELSSAWRIFASDTRPVEIRFRRTVARGDGQPVSRSFWGAPVLYGGKHDRPSVILISLDTLRADFVNGQHPSAPATPTLDRVHAATMRYAVRESAPRP